MYQIISKRIIKVEEIFPEIVFSKNYLFIKENCADEKDK